MENPLFYSEEIIGPLSSLVQGFVESSSPRRDRFAGTRLGEYFSPSMVDVAYDRGLSPSSIQGAGAYDRGASGAGQQFVSEIFPEVFSTRMSIF